MGVEVTISSEGIAMQLIFLIVALAALVAGIVGLIKPSLVKMNNRKKASFIYGISFVAALVLAVQFPINNDNPNNHIHVASKSNNYEKIDKTLYDFDSSAASKKQSTSTNTYGENNIRRLTPSSPVVAQKQTWVMNNCPVGRRWDLSLFGQHLGLHEEIPYTGNRAKHIFKAFYFPEADMTLFYNTAKEKLATYTWGRRGQW